MEIQPVSAILSVLNGLIFDVGNNPGRNPASKANSSGTLSQPSPNQIAAQSVGPSTNNDSNATSNFVISGRTIARLSRPESLHWARKMSSRFKGKSTAAAKAATLTFVGGSGAVATSAGLYVLYGNQGSTTLSITAGESLQSVAALVNQQHSTTGVSATLQGNNLVLASDQVGSHATVRLQSLAPTSDSITGVNAGQISSVNVESQAAGTSDAIAGTVVSSAEDAQLVYHGATGGTVAGTASFQLTGTRGSTVVTLTQGESLADVANWINQQTSSTGVVASLNGNNLLLSSDTPGSASTVQVNAIDRNAQISTTGVNTSQFSNVTTTSLDSGTEQTLTGQVLQSATNAAVTLQGTSNGKVIDSATFNLSGSLGTTSVSIQQGESLADVASRVNALTSSTGVQTQVVSNQLVFESTDVGSAARVAVQLTDISHTTAVSGGNAQQITGFQANSFTTGATETLSGTVTQAASAAAVSLQGTSGGAVIDSATFNLTGSLGTTSISISQGESLANVAAQVNALTGSTGVQAQVASNQLVFQSTNVGSAANVAVQLTNITHTTVVSGVNAQQITGFQANSFTTGAAETLSGTVTQSASAAAISLQGSSGGGVIDSATFNLTGSLGATSVSITQGESLATVAAQGQCTDRLDRRPGSRRIQPARLSKYECRQCRKRRRPIDQYHAHHGRVGRQRAADYRFSGEFVYDGRIGNTQRNRHSDGRYRTTFLRRRIWNCRVFVHIHAPRFAGQCPVHNLVRNVTFKPRQPGECCHGLDRREGSRFRQ